MWAFLPGGLLMPAALPTMAVDRVVVAKKWTHNGKFDLQVRGRVESHLQNFLRDYMDPMDLSHSKIQATPKMDYDFRFYCTKEDFAKAMAQACLDIDYLKFKPTAERRTEQGYVMYEDGKEYHRSLNSIWSIVARLGNPYGGGAWGGWGQSERASSPRRLGRQFNAADHGTSEWGREFSGPRLTDDEREQLFAGETLEDPEIDPEFVAVDPGDYTPTRDQLAEEGYALLKDIPHAQWGEFSPPEELENIERWLEQNHMTEAVHAEQPVARTIDVEPEV